MTKKKKLTVEQYQELQEYVISQNNDYTLKYFTKKYINGGLFKNTLMTIFETIQDDIGFEITVTSSDEFYDKYIQISNGMLETRDGKILTNKEEIKEYFEKDEIVFFTNNKQTNITSVAITLLIEEAITHIGKEETDVLIRKMRDKISFLRESEEKKGRVRITQEGFFDEKDQKLEKAEEISKIFGEKDYKFATENMEEKMKEIITGKIKKREKNEMNNQVIIVYNELVNYYLNKGLLEKADYLMERLIHETKKRSLLNDLNNKSNEVTPKLSNETIDELLDALKSYLKIREMIGESKFIDNLITQVKETLKRYS